MDDDKSSKAEDRRRGKNLVAAAGSGNHSKLYKLLKEGVSVNAEEYNRSLFYASQNYLTPLQVACQKGHSDCARTLIQFNADVDAKDRFDVTALHIAAENGHYQCLKQLLEAGAESNCPTKHSKKGCYTAVPHLGGTTPLHLAAANNHIECVKELIQCGADYNATDEKGRTSLYIATFSGFEECALAHLRNAVGRDILSLPGYETQDTPLHFAVKFGMVNCVRELLKLGSDPNHINNMGKSPLHIAVSHNPDTEGHAEKIVKMLVLEGFNVDVNLADYSGFTPLHYVCFNFGTQFVRRPGLAHFLIAYGANPHIKIHGGRTVIENELNLVDRDYTILMGIAQSEVRLPVLRSMRVPPVRMSPTSPHVEHGGRETDRIIWDKSKLKSNWYHEIASNPRSLQHFCRYAIRSSLGHRRMRHIKDLPVPLKLQHYLLLNGDI